MKVFISWSGKVSQRAAMVIKSWLPIIIQSVEPWMSSKDIDAGTRWNAEIAKELDAAKVGIIVVTHKNLNAPWLNFEAGAIAKAVDESRCIPFLFEMNKRDLTSPLNQFQAVSYEKGDEKNKEEFRKILDSVNTASIVKSTDKQLLTTEVLNRAFEMSWPKIEEELSALTAEAFSLETEAAPKPRPQEEILEELLQLSRNQLRILETQESNVRNLVVGDLTRNFSSQVRHNLAYQGMRNWAAHASTIPDIDILEALERFDSSDPQEKTRMATLMLILKLFLENNRSIESPSEPEPEE